MTTKIAFLLLISAYFKSSATIYAQNVTINVKNKTITEVLDLLKQQTDYDFLYNDAQFNASKPVDLQVSNKPIEQVLAACLEGTEFTFQITDKTVLIVKEKEKPQKQQVRIITGRVVDSKGEPLAGVSITIKNKSTGASTNANGNYSLEVTEGATHLLFTIIGFENKEVALGTENRINVTMQDKTSNLDEVVVVGYGTSKKRDLTGAVSQLKTSRLENEAPSQLQDVLRGNVAGMNVGYKASAKGGGSLQVRGRTSINAGTSPLVVLDGAIYTGAWEDINPSDIETVDVLKDASSAAVFGAKSATGVIMVTTKKGKEGKPVINVSSTIGLATMAVNQPVHTASDFTTWRTDVYKSINPNAEPYKFDNPANLPADISLDTWLGYDGSTGDPISVWLRRINLQPIEIQNYLAGKSVDWYNKVFQNGLRQDHNVSVSGKNNNASYYLGAGYLKNEGIVVGDEFNTVRTRANVDVDITKFLSVGMNTQFTIRDESAVADSWGQITSLSPWASMYDDQGKLVYQPNGDPNGGVNPGYDASFTDRLQKTTSLNSTIYANVKLPFGITYQLNFTPRIEFYSRYNHQSSEHEAWAAFGGSADREEMKTYYWQVDNTFKWNKTFNKDHRIEATFLVNAEKFQQWEDKMSAKNFDPNDDLGWHGMGSGLNPIISSDDQYSTGDALMGRVFYAYKDRYLFTGTFRRDGYSAFGLGNPRANFGSAALGWVFSDESFFHKDGWVNYGKLRVSWGSNGNRDVGRYEALSDLTTGKYLYIQPDGTVVQVSQLWVDRMENPGLKWEANTSINLGLDFAMFNNRIDGSIEAYRMKTSDLLVKRSLPTALGFDYVMDNLGGVMNKGFEITLNSLNIKHENFTWRSTALFQLNRNKISTLYGIRDENGKEYDDVQNKWFIGHAIDAIWDWKAIGVYQKGEEEAAARYGLRPGDYKLEDVNNDGQFTNEDKQFLGYTEPRFRWSLRNDFQLYKDFTISFNIYSNWGNKRAFNQVKNRNGFPDRQNGYVYPYWTPENPSNEWARINSNEGSASGFNVYRELSFIRLDNISIAYTIPQKWISKYSLKSLRVYANVRNAAVYKKEWNFWDPEWDYSDNNATPGPTPRMFTFGVNLTL
ncbi:TonB-linked outer membrane protein, SusC/RagA family [bacterium A37T11]|nr:TonB-linked outer membrane protein, SusC/RagA family [bacterium A37T11]